MGAVHRVLQILSDAIEGQRQSLPPADQNIVMAGMKTIAAAQPDRLAQPAPDAIALNGIADFFGYRESDPDRTLVLAFQSLQDECRRRDLDARRSGQEIRPLSQTLHRSWAGFSARHALRAKTLATTRAAGGDDLAAAHGGHASAESVTALPHELARLIGPFHGSVLRWSRRIAGCFGCRRRGWFRLRFAGSTDVQIHAAYKGDRPLSSMQTGPLTGFTAGSARPGMVLSLGRSHLPSKNSDMSPGGGRV